MRVVREATVEDAAYHAYISEIIVKIKGLSGAGIDTSEQKRLIKSIIEYVRIHDYASADYLIQLLEEDLKRIPSRLMRGRTIAPLEPATN